MIAYCWLAIAGSAVFRTWLYVARFGPTDTSYHDMNHSPGTLIFMSSWNRPPRYHAESFGARLIIAPPVAMPGIESAKMPCGPSRFLIRSCSGKYEKFLAQSAGGRCCAKSNDLAARIRSSCEVFGGNMGRT